MGDAKQITKDQVYDAVAPDDFAAMLAPERHLQRTNTFDRLIAATHDHYWNPLDPAYIDFATPWDLDNDPLQPDDYVPALQTDYVQAHFAARPPQERVRFVNEIARWSMSSILHGEQGALNLSASLCHILRDPGAQEYAANQTREEARHVTAFARYIQARWGSPLPCGSTLTALLTEIVLAPEVYKKIIGMQMLVEGLAMGAFSTIYHRWHDPLAQRLCQLVMTDEAFHHRFGKIWADRTIPKLSLDEHEQVELWAAQCFQSLLHNLVAPHQMRGIYTQFGLDPDKVMEAFASTFGDEERRAQMKEATNIFRVLVKTLWNAGIITDRTRGMYAFYVDFAEFKDEGEAMIGDDIAEAGIAFLRDVNAGRRAMHLAAE